MPLNNGGISTIYYTEAYYALPGIKNPTHADYSAYADEEIAAIKAAAVEGADGYRFDAPEGAFVGMALADADKVWWYDAKNAQAIVSHPDPLGIDAATGAFATAEGETVAQPMA